MSRGNPRAFHDNIRNETSLSPDSESVTVTLPCRRRNVLTSQGMGLFAGELRVSHVTKDKAGHHRADACSGVWLTMESSRLRVSRCHGSSRDS